MELQHEFTVPVPVERAWEILNDVEGIAPCMPGAAVDEVRPAQDGGQVEVDGRVKVKLGPISVTYSGTATFLEVDEAARRLVVKAAGKETRGSGTANATITAVLTDKGESTTVAVTTDLAITGKPAQFARGVMVDVSNKLLGQFVDCLSAKITAPETPEPAPSIPGYSTPAGEADDADPTGVSAAGAAGRAPASAPESGYSPGGSAGANGTRATPRTIPPQRTEPEAIDLLGTAGTPVLKRLAPLAGVVVVLLFLLARRRK
ncbi:SRPBCC family protein [Sporichthya polymorpha]|uniref:SRPBCC family protein n=1 Tax=Sporichthya polymorpha TaxID=35751 RepID=UPI0003629662|nr:SRPBCC family protein [Sporichthya polymorpha]